MSDQVWFCFVLKIALQRYWKSLLRNLGYTFGDCALLLPFNLGLTEYSLIHYRSIIFHSLKVFVFSELPNFYGTMREQYYRKLFVWKIIVKEMAISSIFKFYNTLFRTLQNRDLLFEYV